MASAPGLRAEISRRQSNTVRVREHFREHQGEWVSTDMLERLGGKLAWRTRVANARKVFCLELGWTYPIPDDDSPDPIVNRQYTRGDVIVSEYRYWPFVMVGESEAPSPHLWPVVGAPAYEEPWSLKP